MRSILYYSRSRRANPEKPPKPQVARSTSRDRAALLTLTCDGMFSLVAIGIALLFRALLIAFWSPEGAPGLALVVTVSVLSTVIGWLSFTGWDLYKVAGATQLLPFEYTERVVRHIYIQRLETLGWAVAFNIILLSLCLVLPGVALFSKIFLAAVFALVLLAVRKSIPNQAIAIYSSVGVFLVSLVMIFVGKVMFYQPAVEVETENQSSLIYSRLS